MSIIVGWTMHYFVSEVLMLFVRNSKKGMLRGGEKLTSVRDQDNAEGLRRDSGRPYEKEWIIPKKYHSKKNLTHQEG